MRRAEICLFKFLENIFFIKRELTLCCLDMRYQVSRVQLCAVTNRVVQTRAWAPERPGDLAPDQQAGNESGQSRPLVQTPRLGAALRGEMRRMTTTCLLQ